MVESCHCQGTQSGRAQCNAERATHGRQYRILGQELAHEPYASRTQGQARGNFFFAQVYTGKRQVGNVERTDEQDKGRASPQEVQHAFHVSDQHVLQRLYRGVKASIDQQFLHLRKTFEVRGVENVDLRLYLLDGRSGSEAADAVPVVVVMGCLFVRSECRGDPEPHFRVDKDKIARHDPDDGERAAAQPQFAS